MTRPAPQTRVNGLTVSRTVQEWLCEGPLSGRVLAVFEHACDLLIPDERVVALVTPRAGAGPLNVVVTNWSDCIQSIAPGISATLGRREIQAGRLTVCLGKAAVWDPRPGWGAQRTRQSVILDHLPDPYAPCMDHVPTESLFVLLKLSPGEPATPGSTLTAAQKAMDALRAGWMGSSVRLREGVEQMAGLGSGLTPGGDDFLTGVMLWAWLAHPTPADFCCAVAEIAAGRTTTLSAAFLRAAARGECSIAWHALLEAASQGARAKVAQAVESLLAHGATSGADALAGFLWAASLPTPAPVVPERSFPPKAAGR